MEITNDPILLVNEALKYLGFNDNAVQNIISGTIIICFLSLLSLITYMLCREPKLLERWKYPHLVTLGITAIFGFSSFIVASMVVLGLVLVSAIQTQEFSGFNFHTIMIFTGIHILLALFSEGYVRFAMRIVSFTKTYVQPVRWIFSIFSKKQNVGHYPENFFVPRIVLRIMAFNFGIIILFLFVIIPFLFLLQRSSSGSMNYFVGPLFMLAIFLLSMKEIFQLEK